MPAIDGGYRVQLVSKGVLQKAIAHQGLLGYRQARALLGQLAGFLAVDARSTGQVTHDRGLAIGRPALAIRPGRGIEAGLGGAFQVFADLFERRPQVAGAPGQLPQGGHHRAVV